MKSFSRRLGQLSGSTEAQSIAKKWLRPDGLLANVLDLNELEQAIFNYIAPITPEETLRAIERALLGSEDPDILIDCKRYLRVLRQLAYEAELFDRCVVLISKIAKAANVDNDRDESRKAFVSLFPLWFSGTLATIDQRLKVVRSLLTSADQKDRVLGVAALDTMLQATHFSGSGDVEFGTRLRDYGYAPKTQNDVKQWFTQGLDLAKEFACSDLPVALEVRHVVADHFRGLWSSAAMYDELELVGRKISQKGFWPEGWVATRQTVHYDSAGFEPEYRLGSSHSNRT